jgi:prefoldin alpha subunit
VVFRKVKPGYYLMPGMEWIAHTYADKETLVPLTETLFVPAVLESVDKVLVDVGTGYYIEKVFAR